MATVTDTLETVLKLTGTAQMVSGLAAVTAATETVAVVEGTAAAATSAFGASLLAAAGPILATVGWVAGLALVLGKSVQAFGESDLVAVRLGVTMQNLGNVFPTKDLLSFADALSKTTGVDDELIASLGSTAAQFGLTRSQIEKLLPVVLDVAQIKGVDPGHVLQTLLRASRGRAQGLVALGIDPSKIKGDLKDVNNLIDQVGRSFAGGAAAVRGTIPGALQTCGLLWKICSRGLAPYSGAGSFCLTGRASSLTGSPLSPTRSGLPSKTARCLAVGQPSRQSELAARGRIWH